MKKKLLIKNKLTEIDRVFEFIEACGEELKLSPALVMNLNLVLEEVVVNIISYAYTNQEEQEIVLDLENKTNRLILTISDNGIFFNPLQIKNPDTTLSIDERPVGGLGFFLVRKIMDKIDYQRINACNVLTLEKLIK